jgi:hypothetical protein
MVTAMCIYYEQALKNNGATEDDSRAMARCAFGNADAIVSDAVKGLGASLSARTSGTVGDCCPETVWSKARRKTEL